jgi:hypothetical protein
LNEWLDVQKNVRLIEQGMSLTVPFAPLFQPITDSHPDLMPYLVMCCRGGQADLPETPLSVLCHNSHMAA